MFALKASAARQHLSSFMEALATRLGIQTLADDEAFEISKGSPAVDGDRYYNTTLGRIRTFTDQWYTLGG